MTRPGKQPRKKRELTLFGEWIHFLSNYVQVDQTTIQNAAGLGAGTLSKLAREDWSSPKRETVDRIWLAIERFARQLDRQLPEPWKAAFFHSGGVSTDQDKQSADSLLRQTMRKGDAPDANPDAS